MTELNNKIEAMLERVQKAPRYTGGEMNTAVKPWDSVRLHYGFCFPDTYEVGMSHLGMKILYGLVNREPDQVCERFFMPWTDMMELMSRFLPYLAERQEVVLDSGKLVSGISDQMSNELAMRNRRRR